MAHRSIYRVIFLALAFTCLWVPTSVFAEAEATPEQLEFFEKQVRPLLVAHCYSCHSHQSKKLKGDLYLDSRSGMLKGGDSGPSLVPGNLEESLLIDAIHYETYQMPPKGKLPDDQIAILEKWVSMGAPWPKEAEPTGEKPKLEFDLAKRKAGMWALQPITAPTPPTINNSSWPLADLDRFILAGLEAEQLSPASQADQRILIRRLYFDLIGLPPTPEQIARHLQDQSPDAIAHVADELLASPHFGERWGRHWLDLVRYAESRGHEFDSDAPNAWQYRDYVIRAFNADLPYHQFITEQIAGDLLSEPRLNPEQGFDESIIGTGFWHLGEWVHSPVDIRKDETDRFDNMIDVMSKTFLGLTVSCARCHDHKFDAISSKDYYALSGFLQGCDYREVAFESIEPNRRLADQLKQLNHSIQDPLRNSLSNLLEPRISSVENYLAGAAAVLSDGESTEEEAGKIAAEKSLDPALLNQWIAVYPQLTSVQPNWLNSNTDKTPATSAQTLLFNYDSSVQPPLLQDGSIFSEIAPGQLLVSSDGSHTKLRLATYGFATSDTFWKEFHSLPPLITNQRGALGGIRRSGRTMQTPTFELKSDTVSCLVRGNGHAIACVDSHRLVSGPLHGETIRKIESPPENKPFWISMGLGRYIGHHLHLEFTPADDCHLEVLQIWDGPPPTDTPSTVEKLAPADLAKHLQTVLMESLTAFHSGSASLSRQQREALAWMLEHIDLFVTSADRQAIDQLTADYLTHKSALAGQIRKESQVAMGMQDGTGENDHLLIRGSSANPGEEVPRRFLEAIDGPDPLKIPSGSGRMELAACINDPANPLTSRVIVNRLWLHLFGRGIVPTPDDFGNLGQPPTNPALLDHLATRFRAHDQSIKQMIREIVLSRTYQMSSSSDPVAVEKDPKNLLWHHFPPKRLEGEVIRDSLLAISGKLDPKLFGPSIPIHLTNFMEGRGRPGQSGPEDGANRRSIYIAVRRNFLSPFMLAFDTPVPFSTMGRRNVSNVPAQALILMNDPFVLAQARHWSERGMTLFPNDPSSRIRWMYESAFARPPSDSELQLANQFVETQIADRGVTSEDPTIWADLAHTLINVKEFIFIP